MDLTISSVLTMCVLNSILILALCFISKSGAVMDAVGPGCLIGLLMAVVIRMLFPLEFSYTYSIYIEDLFMGFRRAITYVIMEEPVKIRVWYILVAVWLVGIIVCAVKKGVTYRSFVRCLKLMPEVKWEPLCSEYGIAPESCAEMENVRIVRSGLIRSPYLVGIRKPCLALPEAPYGREEFHYIILHESMHVRNKDVAWKVLIDLLCIVFWWNPVFYYLKRELFQMIEMRNDTRILSALTEEEKVGYMECLKSMAASLSGRDMAFGVAFSKNDLKELERRMKLILNDNRFKRSAQVVLSVVVCAVLFLTTAVIIEPYSHADVDNAVVLTSDNTFLIKNGEAYDVYLEGEYIFTTEDLIGFDGIRIYESLEQYMEEKENE